jgi:hypothetical protein
MNVLGWLIGWTAILCVAADEWGIAGFVMAAGVGVVVATILRATGVRL